MVLKFKYFIPLIMLIVPTLIITPIVWSLEPPGILTVLGFTSLIISVVVTYYLGLKAVIKDLVK